MVRRWSICFESGRLAVQSQAKSHRRLIKIVHTASLIYAQHLKDKPRTNNHSLASMGRRKSLLSSFAEWCGEKDDIASTQSALISDVTSPKLGGWVCLKSSPVLCCLCMFLWWPPCFFKSTGECGRYCNLRLSVRPLQYLILNGCAEIHQTWSFWSSHGKTVREQYNFGPASPRGGVKSSNSQKCNYGHILNETLSTQSTLGDSWNM